VGGENPPFTIQQNPKQVEIYRKKKQKKRGREEINAHVNPLRARRGEGRELGVREWPEKDYVASEGHVKKNGGF